MSDLWAGVLFAGIFLVITFINCEPIVQVAKIPRDHSSVQNILGQEAVGYVPEIAAIVGGETAGGNAAQENKYPWQVLYFYIPNDSTSEFVWLCGGTIVNERTILTAAHCTEVDPEQNNGTFLGAAGWFDLTTDPTSPPVQIFEVEDVKMHDRYKLTTTTIYNDIALLILKEDLDLSTSEVQPVPRLADRRLDYIVTCTRNENCVTVGYGVYNQSDIDSQDPGVSPTGEIQDGEVIPDELQELTGTNLVHYKACWRAMRGTGLRVLPTNLCALDKNQGFCFGDSGGFTGCEYRRKGKFYQVGIPSWITSRDCSVGIQVFTRVAKYRRWIEHYKYKQEE